MVETINIEVISSCGNSLCGGDYNNIGDKGPLVVFIYKGDHNNICDGCYYIIRQKCDKYFKMMTVSIRNHNHNR